MTHKEPKTSVSPYLRGEQIPHSAGQTRITGIYSAVILAFFVPIALFIALIGWYNYACFGSPFVTGYQSIAGGIA